MTDVSLLPHIIILEPWIPNHKCLSYQIYWGRLKIKSVSNGRTDGQGERCHSAGHTPGVKGPPVNGRDVDPNADPSGPQPSF